MGWEDVVEVGREELGERVEALDVGLLGGALVAVEFDPVHLRVCSELAQGQAPLQAQRAQAVSGVDAPHGRGLWR